jgi:glutathione synthase/RimK-type ligase-like ATP-grasp enzyme
MVPQRFLQPSSAPVAIATCSEVVGKESGDLRVIEALQRRGVVAVHAVWDEHEVNWSSFSLVVIRSTWDYPERRDKFLAWAKQLRRVLNPWPILRWNTDKRYLDDLARVGLPIIPTHFLEPDDAFEPPPHPFVVKPAVSCGARDTARYEADDEARACEHVRQLQARGRTVMVQPYLKDIEAKGEVAVMFLGGVCSHSIWRGALLNHRGLRQDGKALSLNVRAHEAKREERSLAEQVMAHLPGGSSGLLYARVDLVPGPDGKPLILEVELTEPFLFLAFKEGGVKRLAGCIVSALEHA